MSNLDNFKKDAELFEGDLRLFWAGRMSIVIRLLENSSACQISECVELLIACKSIYDDLIFGGYSYEYE